MEIIGLEKLVRKTNEILSLFDLKIEFDDYEDSLGAYSTKTKESLETTKTQLVKIDTPEEKHYRRRKRFALPNGRYINVDIQAYDDNMNNIQSEIVDGENRLEFCVRNWDFDLPSTDKYVFPEQPVATLKYYSKDKNLAYVFDVRNTALVTKIPDELNTKLLIGTVAINFQPLIVISLDGVFVANIDKEGNINGYTKYECNSLEEISLFLKTGINGILDKLIGFDNLDEETKSVIRSFLEMQAEELMSGLDKDKMAEKVEAHITDISNAAYDKIIAAEDAFLNTIKGIDLEKGKTLEKVDDLKKRLGLE